MRNQWLRLLLLRRPHAPAPSITSQVQHVRPSLIHPGEPCAIAHSFIFCRQFSSSPELAVELPKPPSDQAIHFVEVFGKSEKSSDEIRQDLDLKNVVVSHDLILSVLGSPDTCPDLAQRIFYWVSKNHSDKLSSESYNLMLKILGSNGFVKETWQMIESMESNGYGVSEGTFIKILERFEKDGLSVDAEKLKDLYASGSAICDKNDASRENDVGRAGHYRISEIIRSGVWDDGVEKQLRDLDVEFLSDLIARVLESLEMEPNKALIFFSWVEESGLFKHDRQTHNALTKALSKEDDCTKFWRVANEMRSGGHDMERETYVYVLDQFVKRRMIKDAVDLYEFAMLCENKPSAQDCIFLLKEIVVSEELDMDLFLKVVRFFKASGNVLTDAHLDAVIESLISFGKVAECNEILAAMKEAGYQPGSSSLSKLAFQLGSGGYSQEAQEFMDNVASTEHISDDQIWVSLVEGYCMACHFNEASYTVRKMVEDGGDSHVEHALDLLVGTYCRENRPLDAYEFVVEMINDKGLRLWQATYKALTSKLLANKHFAEAIDVMGMMKNQGYSADLDLFVEYLSRTGSVEDAVMYTKAITTKRATEVSVFIQLFEAYFEARRHTVAQDFLSKCPGYIKNHADVLILFNLHSLKRINKTISV